MKYWHGSFKIFYCVTLHWIDYYLQIKLDKIDLNVFFILN